MLTRSALSLNKSARNLSCGIHSFFIVHAQREKVDVRLRFLGRADSHVDDRIAVFNHDLSVCLLADLADFQLQESASQCSSEYSVIFKSWHN